MQWQRYLEQLVDLVSARPDLGVALVEPVLPVVQVEQSVVLVLLALEQRLLGPRGHHALDLLHVVLGLLDPHLQVVHLVAGLLDVAPHTWTKIGITMGTLEDEFNIPIALSALGTLAMSSSKFI